MANKIEERERLHEFKNEFYKISEKTTKKSRKQTKLLIVKINSKEISCYALNFNQFIFEF